MSATMTPKYIEEVRKELESRGWQPDASGDAECADEACAAGAEIIGMYRTRLAAAEQKLESTRGLLQAWEAQRDAAYAANTELRARLAAAEALRDALTALLDAMDVNEGYAVREIYDAARAALDAHSEGWK